MLKYEKWRFDAIFNVTITGDYCWALKRSQIVATVITCSRLCTVLSIPVLLGSQAYQALHGIINTGTAGPFRRIRICMVFSIPVLLGFQAYQALHGIINTSTARHLGVSGSVWFFQYPYCWAFRCIRICLVFSILLLLGFQAYQALHGIINTRSAVLDISGSETFVICLQCVLHSWASLLLKVTSVKR